MKKRFKTLRPNGGIITAINQNNILIFIVFSFLLGLLIGVMTFKVKNTGGNFYSGEFKSFISGLTGGVWNITISAALQLLPFIAALFLSGTCMAGAVLTPVIIGLRGAMLGMIISYAYVHCSLTGIVFNLLIIVPSAVISSMAFILSARESFGFSLSLARLALPGTKCEKLDKDFKLYCMRQIFVLVFFLAAVILQTVMASSFYSFFNLNI